MIAAARAGGALVAVDVLHPGRPRDLKRLAGLLAGLLVGATLADVAWHGIACGSLVATGLGSDAGIENFGQVLDFLSRAQPAVAGRIKPAGLRSRCREQANAARLGASER